MSRTDAKTPPPIAASLTFASVKPKEPGAVTMWISRRSFVLVSVLFLGVVLGPMALGQPANNGTSSPVNPGDMSKPMFDTTKPVYDPASGVAKAANTMVAEVEGRAITLGDVGDAIRALPPAMSQLPFEALYPGILDQLVSQQALVIRAQNQGIDEDPTVRRKVKAAGDHTLADEYLRREAAKEITEDALLARYKRDFEGKPGPEEVRARIIMVSTEKEAADLIAEINGGADFATIARRSSKDPTGAAGGDLGFNTREGLNGEVSSVIFAMREGQLVPYPVRSVGSWFVIRIEERRLQPTPSFASVRDQINHTLLQEGATRLALGAINGFKVRQFDLLGREVGEYQRPPR
jgi:peptidyl-prolyl cis-trans isomerase C